MTDAQIPPRDPGRSSRFPTVPPGPSAFPAAVSQNTPAYFQGAEGATPGTSADLLGVRYSRTAVSPIPMMVVAAIALGAAAWAYQWSAVGPGATDPEASEWWINVVSVLLPGESPDVFRYSEFRMWVTIALMVVAAGALALWIGRIGTNLRNAHEPFGSILPIIALPAWWILPTTLGTVSNTDRSSADLILRLLISFAILFAQFLLIRWPLLNRVWRAGRLRYDLASVVLWLPMLIPWSMLFLSWAFTLFYGDDDPVKQADSPWRPTPAMADWSRNVTRATSIGILALLVVVTIAQQIGIQKDRAEERARRDANADPLAV